MNPNSTVRLWLLACGKQYGINNAHLIDFPDAKTRSDQDPYFVYKLVATQSGQVGTHDQSTASGYNASRSARKKHLTTVQVDLYDSQDGLYELASMCVALQSDPVIRGIFDNQAEFFEMTQCLDLSIKDGNRVDYHQRMICTFEENIEFTLEDTNAIVETIEMAIESGGYEWTITDTGFE
ncbi:MAG: hypothetical protein GY869_11390 [Planctomycetes bacterium]|nr:hypothetical protein [Planctomycetota bacterium]